MAKIKSVGTIKQFMKCEHNQTNRELLKKVLVAAGPALVLLAPKTLADSGVTVAKVIVEPETTEGGTFDDIYRAIMDLFDAGVVLVIVFAGAAWALGHRTKAIEIIIGVCCGYLLARRAIDIRDFLRGIGD